MRLTAEELDEFKKITLEVKGLKLTNEQALDQGLRLIVIFDLLARKTQKAKHNLIASTQAKAQNR